MGTAGMNLPAAHWSVRSAHPMGPTVVHLHGDVDSEVAPALQTCLLGGLERGVDVVVDLTEVALLDCVCQRILLRAHCRAQALNRLVVLAAPSPSVQRTLAATRVDRMLYVNPHVDKATVELRQHASRQHQAHRRSRHLAEVGGSLPQVRAFVRQ